MPVIIASISDYSNEYIESWAKNNDIDIEKAIDQIISSVRDEADKVKTEEDIE